MSIINSDGYNADWQLKVLRGLQGIVNELSSTLTVTGNVTIVAPIGQRISGESIPVVIAKDQFSMYVYPTLIISVGDAATLIPSEILSISFANNGTVPVKVTFDNGASWPSIPVGTTINMDAAGIMNTYPYEVFGYDTSDAGASLIITYNTY
jgi:hypothetical protein